MPIDDGSESAAHFDLATPRETPEQWANFISAKMAADELPTPTIYPATSTTAAAVAKVQSFLHDNPNALWIAAAAAAALIVLPRAFGSSAPRRRRR